MKENDDGIHYWSNEFKYIRGASSETSKGKTDYKQRSKEQLNNGKIHAVHTEEKAEKLGIETAGKNKLR